MSDVAQDLIEVLNAQDTGDRARIDRAWAPLLVDERAVQVARLARAALVVVVQRTVDATIDDQGLEELAHAIRVDTIEGARLPEELFLAALLMARGPAETAREISDNMPDGVLLVLAAIIAAVLSRRAPMDRAQLLASAVALLGD